MRGTVLLTGGSFNPLPDEYFAYVKSQGGRSEAVYPNSPRPDLSRFGSLLLCGGVDIHPKHYGAFPETDTLELDEARDVLELALLDAFIGDGKPVYGICRGLQVINVYFGGTLWQNLTDRSNNRHRGLREAPKYHRISWADTGTETVNSYHHQGIKTLGRGLIPLAFAEDGIIEAAAHEKLDVFAVQWHPEKPFSD